MLNTLIKRKSIVMMVFTAASAAVACIVIVGASDLTGDITALADETTKNAEGEDVEFAALVQGLVASAEPTLVEEGIRDPLKPYRAPKQPVKTTPKPKTAPKPTYVVAAVIIDENPRAIVRSANNNVVVKVGDMLGDDRVTRIEYDGVTVESGKTYPYP
jgi:hypothetical protein